MMKTPTKKRQNEAEAEEIFLSASKRRDGVMNLSPSTCAPSSPGFRTGQQSGNPEIGRAEESVGVRASAIRRGIIKIDPVTGKVSPLKSSPGRSRASYDFDRIARRRALLATNSKLDPFDRDLDDLSEDDVAFAEKIIEESFEDSPVKRRLSTPTNKRLLNFNLSDADEDHVFETVDGLPFSETPIPSPGQEKKILEEYSKSHGLVSDTLFVDGPEGYFEQHKFKGKPSGNTMAHAPALEYESFTSLFRLTEFLYYNERSTLKNNYRSMFTQYYYELSQGFSLCFYGVGSKRRVIQQYVDEFLLNVVDCPVLVVNGYNTATTIKTVVKQMIQLILAATSSNNHTVKFPTSPFEAVPMLTKHLAQYSQTSHDSLLKLVVVVHNIDGDSLRSDKVQSLLAQIASLKQIWLIASVDNINAPVLWDSAKSLLFNFAWHDLTTYDSYVLENGFRDVLSAGKSGQNWAVQGAKYVLSSLTQNARNLYRVLVSNQLQAIQDSMDTRLDKQFGSVNNGIEFKMLYNLCVEEFIASNEISFRIMLREFIEHDMAGLSKNSAGTEIVFVPLSVEELENLLVEELLE